MTFESERAIIENAAIRNSALTDPSLQKSVEAVIEALDTGILRVASPESGSWVTHEWLKHAILLYFRMRESKIIEAGELRFFDKIPLKYWNGSEGVRVVPHAIARRGAFIHPGVILMPSFINIGAYVGEGTMVDTWATVGSCAQIGKNVHLSGGVGIGGVLEPVQADPVVIEDHVFVGSRAIIVEGVRVEEGAVIGAGTVLTASTRIIDVTGKEALTLKKCVPARSVVIPGTIPKNFEAGQFGVPCALIIGKRGAGTDQKTTLNNALRDYQVSG